MKEPRGKGVCDINPTQPHFKDEWADCDKPCENWRPIGKAAPEPPKHIVKNRTVEGGKEFWDHIDAVSKEVEAWPEWQRSLDPIGEAGKKKYGNPAAATSASPQPLTAEQFWPKFMSTEEGRNAIRTQTILQFRFTFAEAYAAQKIASLERQVADQQERMRKAKNAQS